MDYGEHYSVLKKEVLSILEENFDPSAPLNFSDLTFGAGGHTFAISDAFPNSHIYSFDQDPEAIANGTKRIESSNKENKIKLIDSNFADFENVLKSDLNFDAVLLDAGVSSHQFDKAERGFSFRFEADLDMRMNPNRGASAADLINGSTESEIADIIKVYGEEKLSSKIAKAICEEREKNPIKTTKQLENICFHAYPKKMRHGKIHPATKTFQAFRIKVNNEIGALEDIIAPVIKRLKLNGLFLVITFHSLEDRVIKHGFKNWSEDEFPIEIITKKPILPSSQEIFENSRSRSAKLRVIRRVSEWPSKNKYPKKE